MKIGILASFGHNVADSLASGMCFMVGMDCANIYGEAAASPQGFIVVDFITGSISGSPVTDALRQTILAYSTQLPELAQKHALNLAAIQVLSARFGTDPVVGRHFQVTVQTSDGKRSIDQYVGSPGKRYRRPRRSTAYQGMQASDVQIQSTGLGT